VNSIAGGLAVNSIAWVTGQFEARGETSGVSWEMVARQEDDPDGEAERWSWYVDAVLIGSKFGYATHVEVDGIAPDEVTAKKSAMAGLQCVIHGFCAT